MILTMRPYAGEQDLPLIVDLINACEASDRIDEGTSVDELWRTLDDPRLDQARDLQLWLTENNTAVGFGQLRLMNEGAHPEGILWFKVHPEVRTSEIEAQIFAWAETRIREQGQTWDVDQVKLIARARDDQPDQLALLRGHGFAITRFFMTMEHPLNDALPEPHLPTGFTLRQVAGEHEMGRWVEMFNQSFIDHWNHHPLTVEQLTHYIQNDPHYRIERDLIAVSSDGIFAAFCFCSVNPEENARNGRNEGWINVLGTRRGFRKIGLGALCCSLACGGWQLMVRPQPCLALTQIAPLARTGCMNQLASASATPGLCIARMWP